MTTKQLSGLNNITAVETKQLSDLNNITAVETKQLSDLNSITTVANSDLLLVREVSTGTDSKITVANFSKGIGTSATVGFTAVAANGEIVLTPSNLATVQEYKDGMIISFKAPLDNQNATIINVKIGNLASKPLYSYNSATGFKFALNDYIQAVYYTDSFNRINPQIKITDADEAQAAEKDDYLSINSAGISKKIKFNTLVQSMGEPTVFGFTAVNTGTAEAPVLTLTPSNSGSVTAYKNGMKISFRAPLTISKTTVVTNIKIGNLDNIPLYKYNTENNCVYTQNDFVEAIFVDNKFYRVGDYSAVVFSNEYRVLNSVIEVINDITFTTLTLVSAYGISKPEYYEGMQLNFVCPIDTQGTVRVNVDGLNNVVLMDTMDGQFENTLNSDLFTGQFVQATLIKTPLLIFKRNIFALNDVRKDLVKKLTVTIDPETGEPIEVVDKTVMLTKTIVLSLTSKYTSLAKAVKEILNDPNYKITQYFIDIQKALFTSNDADRYDTIYAIDVDLSNITLFNSISNTFIINTDILKAQPFAGLSNCKCFNIKQGTTVIYKQSGVESNSGHIYLYNKSSANFENVKFLFDGFGNKNKSLYYNFQLTECTFALKNVVFEINVNGSRLSRGLIFIDGKASVKLQNVTYKNSYSSAVQESSLAYTLIYSHYSNAPYYDLTFDNISIESPSAQKCLLYINSNLYNMEVTASNLQIGLQWNQDNPAVTYDALTSQVTTYGRWIYKTV